MTGHKPPSGQINSNGTLTPFEPFVLHIVEGINRDLTLLNKFGYLKNNDYEDIVERLPKLFEPHAAPHTPPGPSPVSTTPTPGMGSPGTSSKRDSKNSSPKLASQERTIKESEGHPDLTPVLSVQPSLLQQPLYPQVEDP
ncbi:5257_t:CDS:1, partial [Acaulospora colombiana]